MGVASLTATGTVVTRHEAPDVSWTMARRPPPSLLQEHLVGYCGYEEHAVVPLRRRETPSGQVTVILSFGDPIEVTDMSDSPTPRPGQVTSFVAGFHEGYALVENPGRQSGVQVDLTPLGAYRLFGFPMRELANQVIPLDALWPGPISSELVERLALCSDWDERFNLLDQALAAWVVDGPEPDVAVTWAWQQLHGSSGLIPVALLADEIGWSHRHFVQRFRDQVGLAPKSTGRVLRFARAVDLLHQRQPGASIADVAATCGYSDHSHLIREFRRLAGCTPSELLAAELPADGGICG